jgi:hypothetical protein
MQEAKRSPLAAAVQVERRATALTVLVHLSERLYPRLAAVAAAVSQCLLATLATLVYRVEAAAVAQAISTVSAIPLVEQAPSVKAITVAQDRKPPTTLVAVAVLGQWVPMVWSHQTAVTGCKTQSLGQPFIMLAVAAVALHLPAPAVLVAGAMGQLILLFLVIKHPAQTDSVAAVAALAVRLAKTTASMAQAATVW